MLGKKISNGSSGHTLSLGETPQSLKLLFFFFFFAALHQQDAFTGLGLLVALLIWFNKQAASVKRDFIKKKKKERNRLE